MPSTLLGRRGSNLVHTTAFFCGVRCSVGVRLSFDSMLTGTVFFWGSHPATSHATFCREEFAVLLPPAAVTRGHSETHRDSQGSGLHSLLFYRVQTLLAVSGRSFFWDGRFFYRFETCPACEHWQNKRQSSYTLGTALCYRGRPAWQACCCITDSPLCASRYSLSPQGTSLYSKKML